MFDCSGCCKFGNVQTECTNRRRVQRNRTLDQRKTGKTIIEQKASVRHLAGLGLFSIPPVN